MSLFNIQNWKVPSRYTLIHHKRAAETSLDTVHWLPHDAATEQYDYDYVQDDHLLHHNTSVSTTSDAK